MKTVWLNPCGQNSFRKCHPDLPWRSGLSKPSVPNIFKLCLLPSIDDAPRMLFLPPPLRFQNVIAFLCWNESEPSINQSNNSHFCDTQTRACGIFFRAFCARRNRIERQEKKLSERHWAESNTYKQGECSENSVCLVQLLAGLASHLGFHVLSWTDRLSSLMI